MRDGDSGLHRLVFVRELRAELEQIEVHDVELLRENGVPWSKIGEALGVSGQAVSMRYRAKIAARVDRA